MIVRGASQPVPFLTRTCRSILDLTKNGCMTTKTNIDTVTEKLLQVDTMDKSTAIVLDLFSNVVNR